MSPSDPTPVPTTGNAIRVSPMSPRFDPDVDAQQVRSGQLRRAGRESTRPGGDAADDAEIVDLFGAERGSRRPRARRA